MPVALEYFFLDVPILQQVFDRFFLQNARTFVVTSSCQLDANGSESGLADLTFKRKRRTINKRANVYT